MQQAICIEIPACNRGAFSPASLAGDVAAAFDMLRDVWTPKQTRSDYSSRFIYTARGIEEEHYGNGWRAARVQRMLSNESLLDADDEAAFTFCGETPADPEQPEPIVPAPVFGPDWDDPETMLKGALGELVDDDGDCGSDDDLESGDPSGFKFGYAKGGRKPRRPKRNLDKEYRSRAKEREKSRNGACELAKRIDDDFALGLVLNRRELACEALDIVTQPEDDPALEVFRRGVIAWGQAAEPFPYAFIYFDARAQHLNTQGFQPKRPRFPSRMPGAVTGEHAACAEHGLNS